MRSARVREIVDAVHLFLRKRQRRRRGDHGLPLVKLDQGRRIERVRVEMDQPCRFHKSRLVGFHFFIGWQPDRLEPVRLDFVWRRAFGGRRGLAKRLRFFGPERVGHAAKIAQVGRSLARRQAACNLEDVLFAHAVHEQIGFGIEHDRTPDGVAPVIVMGQSAQRCLDAAGNHRNAGKCLAGALTIRKRGPVGAQADAAAGRVCIVVPDFFVGGVMVDERIHIPGADREEQPGLAELPPWFARSPVGLAEHGHAEAGLLEHAVQNRHRETRMVDISVAGDEDDVDLVPTASVHLGRRHRRVGSSVAFVPKW